MDRRGCHRCTLATKGLCMHASSHAAAANAAVVVVVVDDVDV